MISLLMDRLRFFSIKCRALILNLEVSCFRVIVCHSTNCFHFPFSFPVSILSCVQDGGLLINNPTALAIHECKCLWPNTPLQCVLSLGTGRYETAGKNGTTYTSLKAKLTNVISSATDTEGKTL